MNPFGYRLHEAMTDRVPICVGIDPHPHLLQQWGLADSPEGLAEFSAICVDALAGKIAVLKPQSAFFERHGSRGIGVLEHTIQAARAAGSLVLLDIKRGDIGSTAAAYADAYLDPASSLFVDAVTVSPYLGFGSVQPFLDRAAEAGSGVFVLARTSNPEGEQLQQARRADGRTVAQEIVDSAAAINEREIDAGEPLGSVGVVVGATVPAGELDLSRLDGPVLAPGLGAQGARASDLRRTFGDVRCVLGSSSRDVLSAGPQRHQLLTRAVLTAQEVQDA